MIKFFIVFLVGIYMAPFTFGANQEIEFPLLGFVKEEKVYLPIFNSQRAKQLPKELNAYPIILFSHSNDNFMVSFKPIPIQLESLNGEYKGKKDSPYLLSANTSKAAIYQPINPEDLKSQKLILFRKETPIDFRIINGEFVYQNKKNNNQVWKTKILNSREGEHHYLKKYEPFNNCLQTVDYYEYLYLDYEMDGASKEDFKTMECGEIIRASEIHP